MRTYNYKIQWLFYVTDNFVTSKAQLRKNLYSVIRILGARSLTKVVFRDKNLKILDNYSNMVMYGDGVADEETIKYIKKQLKKNPDIYSVELVRTN